MTQGRPKSESELVEFVRSIDVRAPDSLHRQVDAMVARSSARRRPRGGGTLAGLWRSAGWAPRLAAAAAVAAAAALAIALSVGGASNAGPTLGQTAALTLRPPTAGAPAKSPNGHAVLTAAVDGVSFPYWEDSLGWRSTGTRTDRLGGRTVMTVFYSDRAGQRVGYAIVSGKPAPKVTGGQTALRRGRPYRLLVANGEPVVTWLRDGRMCVVSGSGVSAATLLKLASWHAAAAAI
jgi:hypothetical protein